MAFFGNPWDEMSSENLCSYLVFEDWLSKVRNYHNYFCYRHFLLTHCFELNLGPVTLESPKLWSTRTLAVLFVPLLFFNVQQYLIPVSSVRSVWSHRCHALVDFDNGIVVRYGRLINFSGKATVLPRNHFEAQTLEHDQLRLFTKTNQDFELI